MKTSGRADDVFYAGPHDIRWVLDWVRSCNLFYITTKDDIVSGAGWIQNAVVLRDGEDAVSKGELGFGFTTQCSAFEALESGKMILDDIFESYPRLEYLFGTTPVSNEKALKYARILGLEHVAVTPSFCCYKGNIESCVTTYLSQKVWKDKWTKTSKQDSPVLSEELTRSTVPPLWFKETL